MIYVVVFLLALVVALVLFVIFGKPKLSEETDAIIDKVSKRDSAQVVAGKTGYVESGDVRIWYESIFPQETPKGVVLFNCAMGGDSLFWPPKFIRAFTNAGYQVVRYDYRGTGPCPTGWKIGIEKNVSADGHGRRRGCRP